MSFQVDPNSNVTSSNGAPGVATSANLVTSGDITKINSSDSNDIVIDVTDSDINITKDTTIDAKLTTQNIEASGELLINNASGASNASIELNPSNGSSHFIAARNDENMYLEPWGTSVFIGGPGSKQLSMTGGNSFSYVGSNLNALGEGLQMAYNYNVVNNSVQNAGGASTRVQLNFNDVAIFTSNGVANQTPTTEVARFTANGNVGIGTSNPSEKLEVIGNTRTDDLFVVNQANVDSLVATNNIQSDTLTVNSLAIVENINVTNNINAQIANVVSTAQINTLSVRGANTNNDAVANFGGKLRVTNLNAQQPDAIIEFNPNNGSSNFIRVQDDNNLYLEPSGSNVNIVGSGNKQLTISGGNSSGFIGGNFNAFFDGLNLTYNHDIANNVVPVSAGNSTRLKLGYDNIEFFNSNGVLGNIANNQVMVIRPDGNVGFGTSTPSRRLDVNGETKTTVLTVDATTQLTGNVGISGPPGNGSDVLVTNGTVLVSGDLNVSGPITSGGVVVTSDSRIKKEIQDIDDEEATNTLMQIKPRTYKYIDSQSRTDKKVVGFIAQELKESLPYAVDIRKNYIPNIMKKCVVKDEVLQLENHELVDGDLLKLRDTEKTHTRLVKVVDENNIELLSDPNFMKIEKPWESIKLDEDSCVFVYGKQIEDFHFIKKDYIFTVNVAATQELVKKQKETEQRLVKEEKKSQNMMNMIGQMKREIEKLRN